MTSEISKSGSVGLAQAELLKSILQARESYQESVTGKTFDQFFRAKYKQMKPNDPQFQKKLKAARADYNIAFEKEITKQFPRIWTLYQNALNGGRFGTEETGLLLIGKSELRESKHAVTNFQLLTDKVSEAGAIFGGQNWSLLKNDLVILGTAHAKNACMLYREGARSSGAGLSDEKAEDPFWNRAKNAPSVLAREIALLRSAGYEQLAYPRESELGTVFVCKDPEKAESFSLQSGCAAAQALHNPQSIYKFLRSAPE